MRKPFFNISKIKAILTLLFLFLLLCSSAKGEDSLRDKFPLNDPRNPNCPCHKYQKLADDEYKKLLGSNKNNERQNVSQLNNGQVNLSKLTLNKKKKRIKSLQFLQFKNMRTRRSPGAKIKGKHTGFFKRHVKTDSCFQWR